MSPIFLKLCTTWWKSVSSMLKYSAKSILNRDLLSLEIQRKRLKVTKKDKLRQLNLDNLIRGCIWKLQLEIHVVEFLRNQIEKFVFQVTLALHLNRISRRLHWHQSTVNSCKIYAGERLLLIAKPVFKNSKIIAVIQIPKEVHHRMEMMVICTPLLHGSYLSEKQINVHLKVRHVIEQDIMDQEKLFPIMLIVFYEAKCFIGFCWK